MRRTARLLTVLAVVTLALAPALAHAQAGRGGSAGSRGARTYSAPPPTQTAPNQARPMERTNTQPGTAAQRPATAAPTPAAAGARPGFLQRNPFMGGMMMGLLGAGLFGLLAGSGFFSGLGSLAGMLGFLLQIALIAGLVFLVVTLLRRRREPQPAGVPAGMMAREMHNPATNTAGTVPLSGGGATRASDDLGIGPADYQAFERLLIEVQAAWSRQDVAALQRLATPEMVQFFREDGQALHERGLKNEALEVKLEQGDLAEAWNEGARDYATVAMRFSYVMVTRELATGRVVEGDPNARVTSTELWTFVRVQGGPWTVSAIQQAG
jgi:predicted lipid-binding transport protein (Tim44 family)